MKIFKILALSMLFLVFKGYAQDSEEFNDFGHNEDFEIQGQDQGEAPLDGVYGEEDQLMNGEGEATIIDPAVEPVLPSVEGAQGEYHQDDYGTYDKREFSSNQFSSPMDEESSLLEPEY